MTYFYEKPPAKPIFSSVFSLPAHGIKKNNKQIRYNRRTGKSFIASNQNVLNLEQMLTKLLYLDNKDKNVFIDYPIRAMFLFKFPLKEYYTKRKTINQRLGDLSNLYQLPEDCLEKAGILKNDALIMSHDGSRKLPTDKLTCELEIYLYKYDTLNNT